MDLNGFIAHFASQLEDTDPAEIKAGTAFRELEEWSSLSALSIIAMVDEEYDVTLKGDDLNKSNTIEDLFNKIKEKK